MARLSKVKIVHMSTKIDEVATKVDETSNLVLKYKTPDFRASATVEMDQLTDGEMWKVGFIQACTDMMFHNTYGDEGYSSWEFPEMTSGQQSMISDSDGRHYPWYGNTDETVTFRGPTDQPQQATIRMNDHFAPQVTWTNPTNGKRQQPNLTRVQRDQSFNTWVVAWNMTDGKSYILKTIQWRMELNITVDQTRPEGKRCLLVSDSIQTQPRVLEENIAIPRCALLPPNANGAQTLIFRDFTSSQTETVVVAPVYRAPTTVTSKL